MERPNPETDALLSDDLADERVQLIVVFDAHKLVDDVTSSHGDDGGNGRNPVFNSQVCVIVDVNFRHGNTAFLLRDCLLQPWSEDLTGTAPLSVEVYDHGQLAVYDALCEVLVVLNVEGNSAAGGMREPAGQRPPGRLQEGGGERRGGDGGRGR